VVKKMDKPVLQKKDADKKVNKKEKAVTPAAAAKNAKPEKKPAGIKRLWRETIGELKKVSWPTPREAWKLTRVVLLVMIFMSVLLGIMDFIFAKLVTLLLV
jgi:preprotein translocase subunit SecE